MAPVAVIAGASSGIGRATVVRLLAEGWDVAILARRGERLRAIARGRGGRVLPVAADLTDEEQLRQAIGQIRAWRRAVDAVVASTGDFFVRPLERTTTAEFARMWRLTVQAKFILMRELLPLLAARGRAAPPRAAIHVASLAAHQDFPGESAYGSAMHGVIGLARSQDAELRDRGIRVAVVSPGLVRTELTERGPFSRAALRAALAPDAIAASICYLIATIRAGGYIPEIFHVPGGIPGMRALVGRRPRKKLP